MHQPLKICHMSAFQQKLHQSAAGTSSRCKSLFYNLQQVLTAEIPRDAQPPPLTVFAHHFSCFNPSKAAPAVAASRC